MKTDSHDYREMLVEKWTLHTRSVKFKKVTYFHFKLWMIDFSNKDTIVGQFIVNKYFYV